MKANRRILLLLVLVMAALLAFFLREAFSVHILAPVLKSLFVLRLHYRAVAQVTYWQIVLAFVLLIGFLSLRLSDLGWPFKLFEKNNLQGDNSQGEVSHLAFWLDSLQRQPQGRLRQDAYSHWYVARYLASLAVDILNRRGAIEGRENRLQGPGWSPPPAIQNYLEIGLRSNPVMFKQMLNTRRLILPDVEEVIHYLESYVERSQ